VSGYAGPPAGLQSSNKDDPPTGLYISRSLPCADKAPVGLACIPGVFSASSQ